MAQDFLVSLGINIASNLICDFVKNFFLTRINPTKEEFEEELKSFLSIHNTQIYSDKIIDFLAKKGDIVISGSSIFAKESILLQSSVTSCFQIKDQSTLRTEHTSIVVDPGGSIIGMRGASINQSSQGITYSA